MKITIQLLLFCLMFLCSTAIFAQIEEEIEDAPAIDEGIPMVEEEPDYEANNRYNGNNQTSPLYKDYQWVYPKYRSGVARKYGILKGGKEFLPMIFQASIYGQGKTGRVILGLENNYGVYNLDLEKWTVPISYRSLSAMKNNYFIAKKGNVFGLIDDNNNALLRFHFSSIAAISHLENYVIASQTKGGNRYNLRYGIYSVIQGKWTAKPIYRQLRAINNENYFTVQNEALLNNIIDVNGKTRFKNWYKKLVISKRRNYYIVERDGKMGIINDKEEEILPIEYQFISDRPYNDGSYLAQNKEGKFGCVAIDGRVTLPFEYDNIEMQSYNSIGITTQNNKCGILQVNNGLPYEIATCDYDAIEKNQGAFIIKQDNKFGLMDLYGQLKSKIEFTSLTPINNTLYLAGQGKGFYLMNNNGEILNKEGYLSIEPIYRPQTSRYGNNQNNFSYLKIQFKDKKFGVIDQTGALMPMEKFDDITGEVNNTFIVQNKGKIGIYSIIKKELIIPCEYDYITPTQSGFYGFKGNNVYSISYSNQAIIRKL